MREAERLFKHPIGKTLTRGGKRVGNRILSVPKISPQFAIYNLLKTHALEFLCRFHLVFYISNQAFINISIPLRMLKVLHKIWKATLKLNQYKQTFVECYLYWALKFSKVFFFLLTSLMKYFLLKKRGDEGYIKQCIKQSHWEK